MKQNIVQHQKLESSQTSKSPSLQVGWIGSRARLKWGFWEQRISNHHQPIRHAPDSSTPRALLAFPQHHHSLARQSNSRHTRAIMESVPSTLPQPEPSHGALLNYLLNPSPLGLAIAILLAVSIPIFLHTVVFRASGLTSLPSILLTGPSGSGKTALVTLVCSILRH